MEWLVFSIVVVGMLLYRLKSININISFEPAEPKILKPINVRKINPVDKPSGQN